MVYPNYYARRFGAQGLRRSGYPGIARQRFGYRPGAFNRLARRPFYRPGFRGANTYRANLYRGGYNPRRISHFWRVGRGYQHPGYVPPAVGYAPPAPQGAPQALPPQWISWAQSCLAQVLGAGVPQDGVMGHATRHAIRTFQKQSQLPPTGMLDSATVAALQAACSGQQAGGPPDMAAPQPAGPPPGDDAAAATAAAAGAAPPDAGAAPPDGGAPPDAGPSPADAPSGELFMRKGKKHHHHHRRRRWGSGFNFQPAQPTDDDDDSDDDDGELFMGRGRRHRRHWGSGFSFMPQPPQQDGDDGEFFMRGGRGGSRRWGGGGGGAQQDDDDSWRRRRRGMYGEVGDAPPDPDGIRAAIQGGMRDENQLTNKVFNTRHPERNGRPIQPQERPLITEWLDIRDRLVRPLLRRAPSTTSGVEAAGNTTGIIKCLLREQDQGRKISFVQRYLRDLTRAEVAALKKAGFTIVSCFEEGTTAHNATQMAYFTRAQGLHDGRRGFTQAQTVGQPANTPVYFAVDTDPEPRHRQAILDYVQGLADGFQQYLADMKAQNKTAVNYAIGIYGSGCVLDWCQAQGIVTWFWQAFAPGWCNNGNVWPNANIHTFGMDEPKRCGGWKLGHLEGWGNEGGW